LVRSSSAEPAPKRTWYISTINLFADLPPSEVDAWVERCGKRTYERGERIIDAHSTSPEQVLVIRHGAVRLALDRPAGRLDTVDVLGPGQMFGISAAFGSTSTGLHADALTRVVACASDGRNFLPTLATRPSIVLNLVRQLGHRVVQYDGHYLPPEHEPVPTRLLLVLKRLALAVEQPTPALVQLPSCVTRGTLARQVGCTRETIARMLAQFEANGIVARHRRAIVVHLDRVQQELANSSEHALHR
jgi:CRP/FNR family transcriptional regulator